ncbi:MAG: Bacterial domain [Solirubrobacteraceae bacterium]|jgi:hypothetical protein|nr:Bacterial domain [Solirubrobacteraceae bacterium]
MASDRQVLRNPTTPPLVGVITVGFLVAAFAYGPTSDNGIIFLVGVAFCVLSIRARVIVTPDGLTVVGMVFRHRYRWEEITNVTTTTWFGAGPVLRLTLRGGKHKRAWGVAVGRGGFGEDWVYATAQRLQERRREQTGQ